MGILNEIEYISIAIVHSSTFILYIDEKYFVRHPL